jgi:hypothetical protein
VVQALPSSQSEFIEQPPQVGLDVPGVAHVMPLTPLEFTTHALPEQMLVGTQTKDVLQKFPAVQVFGQVPLQPSEPPHLPEQTGVQAPVVTLAVTLGAVRVMVPL